MSPSWGAHRCASRRVAYFSAFLARHHHRAPKKTSRQSHRRKQIRTLKLLDNRNCESAAIQTRSIFYVRPWRVSKTRKTSESTLKKRMHVLMQVRFANHTCNNVRNHSSRNKLFGGKENKTHNNLCASGCLGTHLTPHIGQDHHWTKPPFQA